MAPPKSSLHEYLWVKIPLPSAPLFVCSVYRPPDSDVSIFDGLEASMGKIRHKNATTVLFGDFNTHSHGWLGSLKRDGSPSNNAAGVAGEDFETRCEGLKQLVSFATHEVVEFPESLACIDLVFTNKPHLFSVSSFDPLSSSKPNTGTNRHSIIVSSIDLSAKLPSTPQRTGPNFAKADWEGMLEYLGTCVWLPSHTSVSPKELVDSRLKLFYENLEEAVKLFVPVTSLGGKQKHWFDKHCLATSSATTVAFRKWKKHKSGAARGRYQSALLASRAAVCAARSNYTKLISDKLVQHTDCPKQWHRVMNEHVLQKGYKAPIPGLSKDGVDFTTDQEKADVLNKFFVSTFSPSSDAETMRLAAEKSPPVPASSLPSSKFSRMRIRRRTVLRALHRLNVSKATGNDRVPALLLRTCADVLAAPLAALFRLSLKHGYFPDVWKLADVIALHKKKAKNDPGNYRPISLLAIVSKMLEAIVVAPLSRFLAPLLNSHQFGFRARHTSLDLLTNMTQRWANALNRGDGGEARAIAIDFSKAFDTVAHEGLLLKLERLGVSGTLLEWFRSFLTDRKQRVVVGSSASAYAPVSSGVPQGSVLSPLLFICFINDAFDVVENHLDVFADDSTLWAEIPSAKHRADATASDLAALTAKHRADVAASLDKDLAALNAWAERWLMKFNHSKTELLTISRKKDVLAFRQNGLDKDGHYKAGVKNPHPSLTFGSATLPESACAKIVGLTIASNLSWLPHIQRIGNHANKAVSILHRARNFLSKAALASVYKSHVRSRMEYLSPIWSGALPKSATLDCLDKIQARAAKLVGPDEAFKFQELAHRRGLSGLCFVHRILHKVAPDSVLDLLPAPAPAPARATRRSSRPGGTPFFAQPTGSARLVDSDSWLLSCVPLFVHAFNALPDRIQKLPSLQNFKCTANEAVDLTIHANRVY
jgi:hypothetical protein